MRDYIILNSKESYKRITDPRSLRRLEISQTTRAAELLSVLIPALLTCGQVTNRPTRSLQTASSDLENPLKQFGEKEPQRTPEGRERRYDSGGQEPSGAAGFMPTFLGAGVSERLALNQMEVVTLSEKIPGFTLL